MKIATKTVSPPKSKPNRGEDFLSGLDSLTMTLENNQTVTFDVANEVAIPESFDAIYRAAINASAKYAFWAYQTERSLARVRLAEIELSQLEGEVYSTVRQAVAGKQFVESKVIQSVVDTNDDVIASRKALNDLRFTYGTLRSVRDAIANRTQLLNTLVAHARPETQP